MAQRLKLAKLTRPQLYHTVSRERLHSQFDLLRESYPAIWVTGPPGAGKTTCVSNYLHVRKLPGIWYQLDSNDTDFASFFYYMRIAAQTSVKAKSIDLPLLTRDQPNTNPYIHPTTSIHRDYCLSNRCIDAEIGSYAFDDNLLSIMYINDGVIRQYGR